MNSHLVNNVYEIPEEILTAITSALSGLNGKYVYGVERAKKLLNDKTVTYGQLKKIIHELDNKIDDKSYQFLLCGGNLMKEWSKTFLNGERDMVSNKKDAKLQADNISSNIRNTKELNVDTSKNRYVSPVIVKGSSESLFEQINKIKKLIKCQRH